MNGQRDVGMYGHMMDFWMYRHMDVAMCGKTGEPGNWVGPSGLLSNSLLASNKFCFLGLAETLDCLDCLDCR